MNLSNSSSSAVIFFENFPIIIVSTVYPTLFLFLCLLSLFRNKIKDWYSKNQPIVFPFQKITTKKLAAKIHTNIAEISLMKPSLKLLEDADTALDMENQSSTFYRMKIHDLGNELALRYVQPISYPYPRFSSYISYHLVSCSCLKTEDSITLAQQALELYDHAVIGPAEFTYAQLRSFQEKLEKLNEKLDQCIYHNLWM